MWRHHFHQKYFWRVPLVLRKWTHDPISGIEREDIEPRSHWWAMNGNISSEGVDNLIHWNGSNQHKIPWQNENDSSSWDSRTTNKPPWSSKTNIFKLTIFKEFRTWPFRWQRFSHVQTWRIIIPSSWSEWNYWLLCLLAQTLEAIINTRVGVCSNEIILLSKRSNKTWISGEFEALSKTNGFSALAMVCPQMVSVTMCFVWSGSARGHWEGSSPHKGNRPYSKQLNLETWHPRRLCNSSD